MGLPAVVPTPERLGEQSAPAAEAVAAATAQIPVDKGKEGTVAMVLWQKVAAVGLLSSVTLLDGT
jgi:hypothetical protein